MKKILVFLMSFIFGITHAQSFVETINSEKLSAPREVKITLPQYYEQDTKKNYPILIILDGGYLSSSFTGVLEYGNFWDDLPEMIVVAINQNGEQRFIDSEYDEEKGIPLGEGSAFFEFIGMELIPYIEKKYRTQPFRVIAGHDTTAGFLNFYLYKDDPVFNGYISLAPELAPEMETRIPNRLAVISKTIMYYQASGEGDIEELRNRANTLDQNIKNISNKNLRYQYDDFKKATHYSLVPQAIPQALYFIFDGYQPISMVEYQEKIAPLNSGFTQYLIDRYTHLEEKLGLKVKPRLTDFKAIEAAILKNKKYDELLELSKYAEKNYPKTTLSVFHEALYLEKTKQYKKAMKTYKHAFTREPIRELTLEYMIDRSEAIKNLQDEAAEEPEKTEEEKTEDKGEE
ncbi:alpha/beta hydrolase [Flavobacterium sp.]|uniref:alpha/beta hydrolase n=1 Tax=Flavobacterium sp. TaxID=239 RepID=UPI003529AB72